MGAVVLLVWLWQFRTWFPQGDDFTILAVSGGPGHRLSPGEVWRFTCASYLHEVGRLCNTLALFVLHLGGVPFWLALSAAGTAVGLARWALGTRVVSPGGADRRPAAPATLLVTILAACTLPLICAGSPRMAAESVFWVTGAVNYLTVTALTLWAGRLLVRIAEGRPGLPWGRAAAAAAALAAVHPLHESNCLALLAVAIVAVALRGGRLARQEWLVVAGSLIGTGLLLGAPGLWQRRGAMAAKAEPDTAWWELVHRTTTASAMIVSTAAELWVAVLTVVVLASVTVWWRHRRVRFVWALATAIGALGAGLVAVRLSDIWGHTAGRAGVATRHLPESLHGLALEVSLATIVMVVLLGLTLALLPVGPRPLLAWAGLGGAFAPCLATGVNGERAFLPALLYLALVGLCCCLVVADAVDGDPVAPAAPVTLVKRWGVVLLGLVCVAISIGWWVRTAQATAANRAAADELARRVAVARATHAATVEVPALPNPGLAYLHAWNLRDYSSVMKTSYGLPQSVRLTQGR